MDTVTSKVESRAEAQKLVTKRVGKGRKSIWPSPNCSKLRCESSHGDGNAPGPLKWAETRGSGTDVFGQVGDPEPPANGQLGYLALFLYGSLSIFASAAVLLRYVKGAK